MAKSKQPPQQVEGANGITIVGIVRRVVTRPMTSEDRSALDVITHARLDAQRTMEDELERAKNATARLKKRRDEIEAQIVDLHKKWKADDVDEIVDCRVERTATEVRICRSDNGAEIYSRPLTREEHEALGERLPGMPASSVHHPELDPNDDVARMEQARKDADERAQPITFEHALAEVDAAAEEADKPADAKKKPKKGKKNMNLFDNKEPSDDEE